MRFSIRATHPETFVRVTDIAHVMSGTGFIANTPAAEVLLPRREGGNYLGGSDPNAPRVRGLQPVTETNPAGDYPGVPVMSLDADE